MENLKIFDKADFLGIGKRRFYNGYDGLDETFYELYRVGGRFIRACRLRSSYDTEPIKDTTAMKLLLNNDVSSDEAHELVFGGKTADRAILDEYRKRKEESDPDASAICFIVLFFGVLAFLVYLAIRS